MIQRAAVKAKITAILISILIAFAVCSVAQDTSAIPSVPPLMIVSAASYRGGQLASDSVAVAFGRGLATAPQSASGPQFPTTLGGTQIVVQDSAGVSRLASLFSVAPSQLNFQIPPGSAPGPALVTVRSAGGTISTGSIVIAPTAPGLFSADGTGTGLASASVVLVRADGFRTETPIYQCGSAGCNAVPINLGGPGDQAILELFGTGIRGRSSVDNVTCTIDGVIAPVLYAGPQPGSAGVDQVNVLIPRNLLTTGPIYVVVTVDSQASNAVSISLAPQATTGTKARAAQIVSQMTLAEKIQELHGFSDDTQYRTVLGVPRLGIPQFNITNGPAGATNGGPGHQGPATALPAPISLAATWDVSLAKLYGSIVGLEARDLANGLVEGPDINIARVPFNGRSFEAYGEDPYLVGQIAAAHISGIQAEGVIAESKHYAGNNQETDRGTINDVIDERTLREIYLPAFETTVKQSHVGAVMCAYNKVNGLYSCENGSLLRQILKNEWGFDGFVTSDFGAVHSTIPSANAGLDLEMPTGAYFGTALQTAMQSGSAPMSMIDEKLVRRFDTMMRFGVFDAPPANASVPVFQDGNIARQIAQAGMVLLKNDQSVLPLNAGKLNSVALIGPYAVAAKAGGGGSAEVTPAYTVDPAPAIQRRLGAGVALTFADGSDIAQAAALAQAADVAIVMVGDDEAEGSDHAINLAGTQDQLVATVAAANPRTVVVVKSGGPVLMPWADSVPSILEAWYPGEEDGNAVAGVLFGDANPSGKLPVTFPRNLSDVPSNTPAEYPGVGGNVIYSEGVFVGYRYYDANRIQPLFPFGYGLSYTTFGYDNLTVTPGAFTSGSATQSFDVSFDVTNTGSVPGAEVAQLYLGMPSSDAVPQPPLQLKGFQKVFLNPGQKTRLHLRLDQRSFSYWDANTHGWMIAPGNYRIMVGSSSRDIRLQSQITSN